MNYRCFKKGCELEAQYSSKCLLSEIYCCEFHMNEQANLLNKKLSFDPLYIEPLQKTKDAILRFLEKKKTKREKQKKDILNSERKILDISIENIEETLRNLNSDLEEITRWIEKISQTQKVAKKEEDSLLILLTFNPDNALKRLKEMIPTSSEQNNSIRKLYWLNELRAKTSEIWKKFNVSEFDTDFSKTCALYENQRFGSDSLLNQAYQEYVKAYHQTKSIYQIERTQLIIYDTEEEREDIKALGMEKRYYIEPIQISNGELFFTIHTDDYNKACILDRNYILRELPSFLSCWYTIIYFSGSIYCYRWLNHTPILARFDLEENRLIYLSVLPSECLCDSSVIFNDNILITGNKKIVLYSIDINSFSMITYNQKVERNMQVNLEEKSNSIENSRNSLDCEDWERAGLVKIEERLYLIEFFSEYTLIYESEVKDEYTWKKIAKSTYNYLQPTYLLQNKRKIYFWCTGHHDYKHCCKFDIEKKAFTESSYYTDSINIKQVDKKIVAVNCYKQNLKFNIADIYAWIIKGKTLCDFMDKIVHWEAWNSERICKHDFEDNYYKSKAFMNLDKNLEAIECLNEAFKHEPYEAYRFYHLAWSLKGKVLRKLGRCLEALECYDKAIKYIDWTNAFIKKGKILSHDLGKSVEAIKFYDKTIKDDPNCTETYYHKGNAILYGLGWNMEEIKCYYKKN